MSDSIMEIRKLYQRPLFDRCFSIDHYLTNWKITCKLHQDLELILKLEINIDGVNYHVTIVCDEFCLSEKVISETARGLQRYSIILLNIPTDIYSEINSILENHKNILNRLNKIKTFI